MKWQLSMLHYRQRSNISRTKSGKRKCFSSRLAIVFVQSVEAMYQVDNEDVVAYGMAYKRGLTVGL